MREDDLRFRIAKANVELDDLWPVWRQHQADIQKTNVGVTLGAHPLEHRLDDPLHREVRQCRGEERARREGAHASSVGPAIVIEDPFVILGARQGYRPRSIAQIERRHLGTGQTLLDDKPRSRSPECVIDHRRPDGGLGLAAVLRDDHALSCRQAISLDDDRKAEGPAGDRRQGIVGIVGHDEPGGRNTVTGHEVLGVDLRAFEGRARPGWAQKCPPILTKQVTHPLVEGSFRSDDRQVDRLGPGERQDGSRVHDIQRMTPANR